MSLNETYITVLVGKDLSDTVPIKNDLKQGCFTETSSQLYCTICHYEGSEKTGGLETEWYTSASHLC
jgi:hypothetical protein